MDEAIIFLKSFFRDFMCDMIMINLTRNQFISIKILIFFIFSFFYIILYYKLNISILRVLKCLYINIYTLSLYIVIYFFFHIYRIIFYIYFCILIYIACNFYRYIFYFFLFSSKKFFFSVFLDFCKFPTLYIYIYFSNIFIIKI